MNAPSIDGIIGPGLSNQAEVVAYISGQTQNELKTSVILFTTLTCYNFWTFMACVVTLISLWAGTIIMQVSYGAADTIFNNNRHRFPFFHRTLPSNAAVNIGTLQLMKEMMWSRAGLLSSADPTNARVSTSYFDSYHDHEKLRKHWKWSNSLKHQQPTFPEGIKKYSWLPSVGKSMWKLLCKAFSFFGYIKPQLVRVSLTFFCY